MGDYSFRLTVTQTVPNPNYDDNARFYGYQSVPDRSSKTIEVRSLEMCLSEDEFNEVRMAVLRAMSPKKDSAP